MCSHDFRKINDVKVCIRCGLTFPQDGSPFFDKKIVEYYQSKKGKQKRRDKDGRKN